MDKTLLEFKREFPFPNVKRISLIEKIFVRETKLGICPCFYFLKLT